VRADVVETGRIRIHLKLEEHIAGILAGGQRLQHRQHLQVQFHQPLAQGVFQPDLTVVEETHEQTDILMGVGGRNTRVRFLLTELVPLLQVTSRIVLQSSECLLGIFLKPFHYLEHFKRILQFCSQVLLFRKVGVGVVDLCASQAFNLPVHPLLNV
jgi:hypothetical protein